MRHFIAVFVVVLTAALPTAKIPSASAARTTLTDYVPLGVKHIFAGADHLLFLLLLVLLLRRPKPVILAETAFTLSHGLSFSAAALGWIHVSKEATEACIAMSLLLLALDVERKDKVAPDSDAITIPHNSNASTGQMWDTADDPRTRKFMKRYQVLVEFFQHKGSSECLSDQALGDPGCEFEVVRGSAIAKMLGVPAPGNNEAKNAQGYVRNGLAKGLAFTGQKQPNPVQVGLIGSTDTHNASPGNVAEGSGNRTCMYWSDKSFDPAKPTLYYARVLEQPTWRWSHYDCEKASNVEGCKDGGNLNVKIQERAWTSPIYLEL